MDLRIFQKRHAAELRNPLATPILAAALDRLRPCGEARQLENLVRAGRLSEAIELASRLLVEGHP
jgi:hypothetical protein